MSIEVFKEKSRVYLDYNATSPPASFLKDLIQEWMSFWANPSSTHQTAEKSRALLWNAREQVAQFIRCHPLELIFTSGGSEANNHALKGLFEKFKNSSRNTVITSSVEHPSVREVLEWGAKHYEFQIKVIPVSPEGLLDISSYKKALSDKTAFVSIMYVNNETGCIFPISQLAEMSKNAGALFHCDAVQALGKLPLNIESLGVDLLTLSGHKFYALKGCGVLYVKKGLALPSLMHGGPQERKRRAGTENILSICSLGAVAQKGEEILSAQPSIQKLRDNLENLIEKKIQDLQFIGRETERTANSSSIMIKGVFAETVMMNLDLKGYSVSVSSACHSGSLSPSPVLLGMGYSPEEANCVLRVSLGLGSDKESLKRFAEVLKETVERLRKI